MRREGIESMRGGRRPFRQCESCPGLFAPGPGRRHMWGSSSRRQTDLGRDYEMSGLFGSAQVGALPHSLAGVLPIASCIELVTPLGDHVKEFLRDSGTSSRPRFLTARAGPTVTLAHMEPLPAWPSWPRHMHHQSSRCGSPSLGRMARRFWKQKISTPLSSSGMRSFPVPSPR
jgi:hypothetical protein